MQTTTADFRDLALKHKGKVICVMGGAECLAEDLKKVKADVYVSANAHYLELQEPDYIVAMDILQKDKMTCLGAHIRELSRAPIISPQAYADFRLGDWPQNPRLVLSGMISAWVAFMLGAKVVVIAGCDGYGGQNGYLDEARKIGRDIFCPVRVVSGPLIDADGGNGPWSVYDPDEKFGRYSPHSSIEGWQGKDGRVDVEVLKPCTVALIDRAKGEKLLGVYRHEVATLLRHRMVKEI